MNLNLNLKFLENLNRKLIVCTFSFLISFSTYSQNTISGTVKDGSNISLPGVNIIIKGTNIGVVSDFDGNFSINASSTDTLLFSYIGYLSQEIQVGANTIFDVTMIYDASKLNEVVVTGYGSQRRSDVTGSISSISKERLELLPNNNFVQALQGGIAGINIMQGTAGAEGNQASIIIRGRNSISASNSPLIILDGIPYGGSISAINPTDIESLVVLKDASSAAIYGARGSNGVILITSKKGSTGSPKFSYNVLSGISSISNMPDLMSPRQFYEFKNLREPGSITDSEEAIFQSNSGTNWFDLATREGTKQQHDVTFSGGTEKTKYYFSGSYLDVEGLALNDDFKRTSLRINLESKVSKWLTVGTNTQLTYSDRSGLPASWSGGTDGAFYMNPLTSAYDSNGNLSIYPWSEQVYWGNPLAPTLAENSDMEFKIFTNNFLKFDLLFVPGLSYKINSGIEYTNRERGTYYGRNTKRGLERLGYSQTINTFTKNELIENILDYNTQIGVHSISATALYSYQNNRIENQELEAQGFPNDVLTWYQPNVATLVSPSNDAEEFTILSSMLRLNYGYNNKYLLTLTTRRDGFSGFGSNTKWGNFFSTAFAWNIHNESFMSNSGMDLLKLRVSYGENGNQAVDAYQTLAMVSERSYLNGTNTAPGYVPSKLGNNNLGWESTKTLNIGIDFGFSKSTIRGSLEAYFADTEDILLNRSISPIHGLTSITQNIGATKNVGLELSLFANLVSKDDFSWNVNGNISYNTNEIVDLYGNKSDDLLNRWFIGQPIRVRYGYEWDGVFQTGDDIANSPQPDAQPGFAKIVDQNKDGQIDTDDRTILGKSENDINAGLSMNFKYKNISLDIFSQGAFGGLLLNGVLKDDVWSEVRRNTFVKNWWTESNPTNDYYSNHTDANLRGVGIYEKRDYWRIKDITVSFDIKSASGLKLEKLKLYLSGRNLITITNYGGIDPELGSVRHIPLEKTFSLGLNATF